MTYTDFTKYSHADLRTMAQALDPGAVMAAGDPWRKAATTLKEIRKTLTNVSTEAATSWEGTTSDSFHTSMLTLATNINEAAAYANDAANTLHNMSEAMATAKRTMPEEPGSWDQFKDKVGDFFSSEDDHIQLTDQKKAEAAAVMQTLAMHYRIATPALKAPPSLQRPPVDDSRDASPQADPTGAAAAVAAVVSGASFGTGGASARSAAGATSTRPKSQPPMVARPAVKGTAAPTDSGIRGGVAQALPKSPPTTGRTSSAGISGTPMPGQGGSVPSPVTSGTQTSGLNVPPTVAPGSGPIGGGGERTTAVHPGPSVQGSPAGSGLGAKEFSSGAAPVEGPGLRGGRTTGIGGEVHPGIGAGGRGAAGARQLAGPLARPGGAVGETIPPISGVRGKQAFTEGGSGLGARSRLGGEVGARSTGVMSPGIPLSEAQRGRKNRGKDGKRPDYLVEDEETWASDKPANPNVVE
ncbi:WXG100 family type VII secretion target [Kitasatospora sp. NPDC059146]|uniref:WXG100 family type VII secretion target n=2 Tax=Streptomycetaceae TaxID=2062 RepID=UPI0036CCCBC2